MSKKSKFKSFTWGAVLGGIAAGVTALLFAPKSGKQLRGELKDKYEDLTEKGHDLCDDIYGRGKGLAKDAKKAAKRFMKK